MIKKRTTNFILDLILNGIVLYGLFLLVLYILYSLLPTQIFFTYASVEPSSNPTTITENYIEMESTFSINIAGNMHWHDILRCVENDSLKNLFLSDFISNAPEVRVTETKTVHWRYYGDLPNVPATCYMTSSITRKLPFNIQKTQIITSSNFEIE